MDTNSLNPIPAALWSWFLLTAIMLIGIWILKGGPQRLVHINPHGEALRYNIARLPFIILTASLSVAGFLIFSKGFSAWFKPYANITLPGLNNGVSLTIMFIVFALLVTYIVALTGGSMVSPFTPLFFVLPTLTIFLKVGAPWITSYVITVALLFLVMILVSPPLDAREHKRPIRLAYAVVTVACLALTTFIGLLVLPHGSS